MLWIFLHLSRLVVAYCPSGDQLIIDTIYHLENSTPTLFFLDSIFFIRSHSPLAIAREQIADASRHREGFAQEIERTETHEMVHKTYCQFTHCFLVK